MARHGLAYEQVRARNPRLVYCSITGFGAGPGAALPGYDLLVQAVGGLMSITGPDAGRSRSKAGVALVDVLTGLHAAVGILAALRARERSAGAGQLVEVNLLSALLSSLVNQAAGVHRRRRGAGHHGQPAPVASPRTRSSRPPTGRWSSRSATTGSSPRSATGSASRTSRPTPDSHQPGPGRPRDALAEAIATRLAARPAADWFDDAHPAGGALRAGQRHGRRVRTGRRARARRPGRRRRRANDVVDLVANPIGLSGTPPTYRSRPPRLGEHTYEVRQWLSADPHPLSTWST